VWQTAESALCVASRGNNVLLCCVPSIIKIGDVAISRFPRWRISEVLNFRRSRMGSLTSLCRAFYWSSIETIAVNYLVFEKIAFCVPVWRQTTKQQTDERTDGQHRCVKTLSLSQTAPFKGEKRTQKHKRTKTDTMS